MTTIDPLLALSERNLGGLRVTPVEDTLSYINLMIYGPSGVGKTRLAGSAADVEEMSPVLFVDVEGGTFTLRSCYPQVDVVRVLTWEDMQALYNDLYEDRGSGYKTVVIDSLTETQKFNMYQVMQDLLRTPDGRDRDPDIPSVREWGKNIEQIRKFVRAFRDLPMNTIFTALDMQDRNPRTGMTLTKPSLSGKLSGEVAGFLDIVLYMYKKNIDGELKRLLLSEATDTQIAKDRSAQLPAVLEVTDMQYIYDLVHNTNNNNTKAA
jgi:hypothetical protein